MNNIEELCSWILSADGMLNEINNLSIALARKDFFKNQLDVDQDVEHDWSRLLLAGSILARSNARESLEAALTIAQAGFLISRKSNICDASLIILNQLSNQRMAAEAIKKGYVQEGIDGRMGISARMQISRERIENTIFSTQKPFIANKFQGEFWESATKNTWLYATAPTATGKTYIVFKYLLERIALKRAKLVIYVAPTRALVSEIEQSIRDMSLEMGLKDLSVSSIPLKELYSLENPSVFVFTQERLHIFLNTLEDMPDIDLLIVDEVQKLSDGMRGVILQDAIERVLRYKTNTQIVYLSPSAENPNDLFKDAPSDTRTEVIDRDQPMVAQNIILASQKGENSEDWQLQLKVKAQLLPLGEFKLFQKPTTIAKKMALIAANLGEKDSGYLIYANGQSEAEDIAGFIAEIVGPRKNENLDALSKLTKEGVHKNYKLVKTALCGVAFHYGHMPSLLREEIEEAFNRGDIRFLVCTSTLIEGVNLACKTIIVRDPKKGNNKPMEAHDFWNLAGRAGRWGKEFQGNIICVDPDVWKNKLPARAKFRLKRQTEEVIRNQDALLKYLQDRTFDVKTIEREGSNESVLAYLLTTYLRDGTLRNSLWAKNFDADYIGVLDGYLKEFSEKIDIPLSIIEKHSGISAVSMQTLLNYFRKSYGEGSKKPVQKLIPQTPESTGSYDNMKDLLNRIHLKLYPAFGFGYQYKHFAVLILNWMQGYTLSRLIEDAIQEEYKTALEKDKSPRADGTIIRDTMGEVEEIARFKAPKYISCYTDILKIFLEERNLLDLYPKDYPFDLFLEFGVMTKTLLSLMSLGLSRMTSTEFGKHILDNNLSKESCMQWLRDNVREVEVPDFAKREIKKKLSIQ